MGDDPGNYQPLPNLPSLRPYGLPARQPFGATNYAEMTENYNLGIENRRPQRQGLDVEFMDTDQLKNVIHSQNQTLERVQGQNTSDGPRGRGPMSFRALGALC
ncbi:hypothetical protein HMN09_00208200 [Mycena chlorophos]|uniref:Uncharacterized protein n=1 Tax=Mycena chlorophos TaxID=658473 RepID=A0A8H6WKX4_MYCCL|nr:hypothetical protein HMN09_00208200 [Mycena chlorophos]